MIKRGVNDDQIVPMAGFFKERGQTLRFIEYMDVGHTNGWRLDDVVPAREIVAALDGAFGVEPSTRATAARSHNVCATATAAARSA